MSPDMWHDISNICTYNWSFSNSLVNPAFLTLEGVVKLRSVSTMQGVHLTSSLVSSNVHNTIWHTSHTEHRTQYGTLNTEHWKLNTEHWTLNTIWHIEHWTLQTECRTLNIEHWRLNTWHTECFPRDTHFTLVVASCTFGTKHDTHGTQNTKNATVKFLLYCCLVLHDIAGSLSWMF